MREDWELRARNWFLAHGGSYDEQTGDLVCSDGLKIPRENWKKIVKEIKEGNRKFRPDREKDLLTLVLGNDEHEALALRSRGGLGLPKTKRLTEAEREQSSGIRRRSMTSSTSCLPDLTSSISRLTNLEELCASKILHSILPPAHLCGEAAWLNRRTRLTVHG